MNILKYKNDFCVVIQHLLNYKKYQNIYKAKININQMVNT